MITPPKRYIVARTTTSKNTSIRAVDEIAALLNANQIHADYVAREWTGLSAEQMEKDGDAAWMKISQLLADAYRDKPLITVVLKDVEKNVVIMSERYHSDDSPLMTAFGAIDGYFARCFKDYPPTPPSEFLLYFKSDKCPPSVVAFKLKVGNRTVTRGVLGSKEAPAEETFPYTYDDSPPRTVQPPDSFPPVVLESKPPKYGSFL